MSIISKHAARTETMEKKYVLSLNYPNPRVANSGQYTAADDVLPCSWLKICQAPTLTTCPLGVGYLADLQTIHCLVAKAAKTHSQDHHVANWNGVLGQGSGRYTVKFPGQLSRVSQTTTPSLGEGTMTNDLGATLSSSQAIASPLCHGWPMNPQVVTRKKIFRL
ncbi:hypothetical protein OUZ56_020552 [Daphnia magna]|uniref:Uncharacterized protein n=1 Tax=Daphnia magna TaxID=35525 RepID=A0ABQ9ZF16_9CRUS|nr:hypothetical protein OUZ56_020552 [Daphnia magna]